MPFTRKKYNVLGRNVMFIADIAFCKVKKYANGYLACKNLIKGGDNFD